MLDGHLFACGGDPISWHAFHRLQAPTSCIFGGFPAAPIARALIALYEYFLVRDRTLGRGLPITVADVQRRDLKAIEQADAEPTQQ